MWDTIEVRLDGDKFEEFNYCQCNIEDDILKIWRYEKKEVNRIEYNPFVAVFMLNKIKGFKCINNI
nr:MAG TPA: hypothetical protein [Caudoviricetes sp.]